MVTHTSHCGPTIPTAAVPPLPTPCPLSHTCLQESSAGSAQEHHGVVVDAGDRHSSEAIVGEDGGGGDGVHDGQRVLQVRCSTVQLLRLQLQGDAHISASAQQFLLTRTQQVEPPDPQKAPCHQARKQRVTQGCSRSQDVRCVHLASFVSRLRYPD